MHCILYIETFFFLLKMSWILKATVFFLKNCIDTINILNQSPIEKPERAPVLLLQTMFQKKYGTYIVFGN